LSQEEIPDQRAKSEVAAQAGLEFHGINDAVIQFIRVENYTGFSAEYAWVDGDLVVHFFMPPEFATAPKAQALKWWLETFAVCLDSAARRFFSADYPRLVAKYTEELESWWFRARQYGDVLDPTAFALKFLKELDVELDRSSLQAV
jgi:hypothetical protein